MRGKISHQILASSARGGLLRTRWRFSRQGTPSGMLIQALAIATHVHFTCRWIRKELFEADSVPQTSETKNTGQVVVQVCRRNYLEACLVGPRTTMQFQSGSVHAAEPSTVTFDSAWPKVVPLHSCLHKCPRARQDLIVSRRNPAVSAPIPET